MFIQDLGRIYADAKSASARESEHTRRKPNSIRRATINVNDIFPSKYIKASDLQGKKLKLKISHVEMEEMGDDRKPVLYFTGKEKGLVLNKTKAQILASSYSPETEGWKGKECAIFPSKVNFNGQMVDSISVEPILPMIDGEFGDEADF